MKVRLVSPAEFDRHESEIRFFASADGRKISVTVTLSGLSIVRQALTIQSSNPLTIYAAGGELLTQVVADTISTIGDLQPTYMITHRDVLRVTGSDQQFPHIPKPWERK